MILVGQSYGSATTWHAQDQHDAGNPLYPGGADATLATGWGHVLQTEPVGRFFEEQHPAKDDPKFDQELWATDPGYFTPLPKPGGGYPRDSYADNEREKDYLFYLGEGIYKPSSASGYRNDNRTHNDGAKASIIRLDAKYKQTVTQEELQTFEPSNRDVPDSANDTKQIRVPSCLINGMEELFFCGDNLSERKNGNESQPETDPGYYCGSDQDLTKFEGQFFDEDSTCFTAAVVSKTGHMLNLHKSAHEQFRIAERFMDMAVGPHGGHAGDYCKASASLG